MGFPGRFILRMLLILAMASGGLLFFIGCLGLLNEGFKDEVKYAGWFFIIGLAMMIGSWAAQRQVVLPFSKKSNKKTEPDYGNGKRWVSLRSSKPGSQWIRKGRAKMTSRSLNVFKKSEKGLLTEYQQSFSFWKKAARSGNHERRY